MHFFEPIFFVSILIIVTQRNQRFVVPSALSILCGSFDARCASSSHST